MNSWIDLSAVTKILTIGFLAGAGLPALFAIGLRALSIGQTGSTNYAVGQAATSEASRPIGIVAAAVCFLIVLAAIGYGIDIIVNG